MRLLILGAGASYHACYPLASNLLREVEKYVASSPPLNKVEDFSNIPLGREKADDDPLPDEGCFLGFYCHDDLNDPVILFFCGVMTWGPSAN